MAEVLEDFDGWGTKPFGALRYPWDQWFDGQIWKLSRGEDWPQEFAAQRFRRQVQNRANDRRVPVQTRCLDGDTLVIQATPR